MELVVDANVLLASFLKEGVTRELLLDSRLTFFAPEHLIDETSKHLRETASLRRRIGLSEAELQLLFSILTSNIQAIPKSSYSHRMKQAEELVAHREDAPYIAVALLLKIPLWTNDRGFQNQSTVQILTTPQLIKALAAL